MFLKEFEIRWTDLDANWHLANTSYMGYAAHMRMEFINKIGLGPQQMKSLNIGPVVFNESIHYFKEVLPNQSIQVSAALSGLSAEGKFFSFQHDFYFSDGTNLARVKVIGGWINLSSRKLTALPETVVTNFSRAPKTADFKTMTASDTRKYGEIPKDLKQNF